MTTQPERDIVERLRVKFAFNVQNEALQCEAADTIEALRRRNAVLVEGLEIIAGRRQCLDNLMSNVEVARAALSASMEDEK